MRRTLTWVTLLSITIVVAAMYQVRKVHAMPDADHRRCSVASLKGTLCLPQDGREQ